MHHDRKEITRLLPLPLAFACLLGALLWPHWRDALSEETYCEQSGAALTAAALAVSTLSEPVDCEESPYLCVDGISRYIARVYGDLLGRWPDPMEIDALRAAYPQGLPDMQFAQELVASPEYRDRVVQRLTQRLLGRPATPEEQDYWTPYEHRDITLGLLTSPEYATRTGGTAKAFVAGVYRDLLDREAEPDELRDALARLATHGSVAVVQALYDSEEHHGEQVDRVYLALLRMPPEPAGRAAWVRALNKGEPLEQLIVAIVTSAEYEDQIEQRMQRGQGEAWEGLGEDGRAAPSGRCEDVCKKFCRGLTRSECGTTYGEQGCSCHCVPVINKGKYCGCKYTTEPQEP